MPNVVAVVFAHNEESTIGLTLKILNGLKSIGKINHIVVVNDGSTDNTAQIAHEAGAMVVSHPKNMGKREAFISGAIKTKKLGADVMLNLDADITLFPQKTLTRMVKAVTSKGKLMSIASQHEAHLLDKVGKEHRVRNVYSNAQRAINMKALDPLFNGNPKWWGMFRTKRGECPPITDHDGKTKEKAPRWGLEFVLDKLIPKKRIVLLKDPIVTREPFRKTSHNATCDAQRHGRQIIKDYTQRRMKKAGELREQRKNKETFENIRQRILQRKADRKAVNLRRIQRMMHRA